MQYCNVVIFSYHYLLDPKIAERVSKDFSKDCIVVFDEAHNIDNVCIESLSTDITEDSLRKATRGAQNLENKISQMRDTDQQQLQNEYEKLVQGLRDADEARQEDAFMANPGRLQRDLHLLPCNVLTIPQPFPKTYSKRLFQETFVGQNTLLLSSRDSLSI
jgi:Rad3-related DNA helicase